MRGLSFEITDKLSQSAAVMLANWIGCYSVVWNQKVQQYRETLAANGGEFVEPSAGYAGFKK